ncbi:MAG: tyrosine-type recombinase/integrase, partial [Planctomycetota bacterium]|nr:tyrosine-type recombinase/integrase [Planctomycetota bacterium]
GYLSSLILTPHPVARFHPGCRAGHTKGNDMASISKNANGQRRLQFYDGNGKRRSLGIGSISERNAERIRDKVEQLVEHAVTGTPLNQEVSRWVAGLDDRMHSKLVKVGLTDTRQPVINAIDAKDDQPATLGDFLTEYLAKRTDVKESTRTVYGHVQRNLLGCFGSQKQLREITLGDSDDFVRFLKAEGLSSVTLNRRSSLAKTIFRSAHRHKLISANPFADVKAGTRTNSDRQRFISPEVIDLIIEQAPDAEWRLMIVLARYGGLRIPSELMMLRWTDIDWQQKRIRIHSAKTEHHQGKESRLLPLFPELVTPLQDVWEQADTGSEFVITKNRPESVRRCNGNWEQVNLRTRFTKIIQRAGLTPWPRLWQNLRSSRETELVHEHPLHVVTSWLGNSEAIATKHYLQVTDADFDRASTADSTAPDSKVVRKLVQHGNELASKASQPENGESRKSKPYKEKRLHAEAYSRSEWRIGDLNP